MITQPGIFTTPEDAAHAIAEANARKAYEQGLDPWLAQYEQVARAALEAQRSGAASVAQQSQLAGQSQAEQQMRMAAAGSQSPLALRAAQLGGAQQGAGLSREMGMNRAQEFGQAQAGYLQALGTEPQMMLGTEVLMADYQRAYEMARSAKYAADKAEEDAEGGIWGQIGGGILSGLGSMGGAWLGSDERIKQAIHGEAAGQLDDLQAAMQAGVMSEAEYAAATEWAVSLAEQSWNKAQTLPDSRVSELSLALDVEQAKMDAALGQTKQHGRGLPPGRNTYQGGAGTGPGTGGGVGRIFRELDAEGERTSSLLARPSPNPLPRASTQREDQALDALRGREFEYQPGPEAAQRPGPQYGVSAQELERTPIGAGLVREGEGGVKQVDGPKASTTALALLGRLNERVRELEQPEPRKMREIGGIPINAIEPHWEGYSGRRGPRGRSGGAPADYAYGDEGAGSVPGHGGEGGRMDAAPALPDDAVRRARARLDALLARFPGSK
jgi:hypothetical protein